MAQTVAPPPVTFEITPADYKHWKLSIDGQVATLAMDVREDAGLTRVVDKRKVRRDLADDFSTLTEGVRGKRAVEGRFVDAVYPTSKFQESVAKRAQELAARSHRPTSGPGIRRRVRQHRRQLVGDSRVS